MLFKEILDEKYRTLWPQFEKLYQAVMKCQTHDTDLLLIHINAFYNPEVYTWDNIKPQPSPYMFGPNHEGHSEYTHFDFIGEYVKKNMSRQPLTEYLEQVKYEESRRKEIDALNFAESISIQTEMLIYLKIWESDMFIKKFYQLANLLDKKPYDWHFMLSTSSRPPKPDEEPTSFVLTPTGTRDVIIRTKIRDRFKKRIPKLAEAIQKTYNAQIRNSIAHSQYSILGRHIQLNNDIAEDPYSQLKILSFDEWIYRFHETLVIYTLYREFFERINENYGTLAMQNGEKLQIRISRKDPEEKVEYGILYYREFFKDWGPYPDK